MGLSHLVAAAEQPPQPKIRDALVVTRAGARKEREEEEIRQQKQEESGAQPTAVEDIGESDEEQEIEEAELPEWMKELDEQLFQGGRVRRRLTRAQKKENKQKHQQSGSTGGETPKHPLEITGEELRTLQSADTTLEACRRAADGKASTAGAGFYWKDGCLYRHWTPPGRDDQDMSVEQLVLPLQCRRTVLQVAHEIPLAGYLGRDKTASRVLQRFYWPTLFRDVATFCRTCTVCQKTSQRKVKSAPMVPLPVMEVPFERIAMDIVGPLPRSRSGHRYILVVCDYATRYPEAMALKSIDAEHIAEELLKLFARVGIPKEILTDQGSNFTSQLLAELYRMLHVHPIRTSPYHPQTDGLVERFNQTLKAMLRKAAVEEGKDWDKTLPYLLFAYREVPQASTGFSPFELLYGRAIHGPLDVLRQAWEANEKSDESVVSHVLDIREKMEKMTGIVRDNLEKAQEQQKKWYDANARHRQFAVGDLVLVLLPTSNNKLLAKWQGPYQIVKKTGEVNYQIDMHDRRKRKRKRIFHVNMLRPWHAPTDVCFVDEELTDTEQDEVPVWKEMGSESCSEPEFGKKLLPRQCADLKELLKEFEDVSKNVPGRTSVIEHSIRTKDTHPV